MKYDINQLPDNIKNQIIPFGLGCWLWIGAVYDEKRKHKQPIVSYKGKHYKASRVVMHIFEDFDLNSKLQINHKPLGCNNSLCINPEHMYVGTPQENARDRDASGNRPYANKTLCNYGHELSTSPTTGHCYCMICKNERRNEWRKRRKANDHSIQSTN